MTDSGTTTEASLKREIHYFVAGGKNLQTGEEFGDHAAVKTEWDDDLDRMLVENPVARVSCIEYEVTPEKDASGTIYNLHRKVLNHYSLAITEAVDWIKLGTKSPALDVTGHVNAFNAIYGKEALEARDQANELVKTQAGVISTLMEELREMRADINELRGASPKSRATKKTTSKKEEE